MDPKLGRGETGLNAAGAVVRLQLNFPPFVVLMLLLEGLLRVERIRIACRTGQATISDGEYRNALFCCNLRTGVSYNSMQELSGGPDQQLKSHSLLSYLCKTLESRAHAAPGKLRSTRSLPPKNPTSAHESAAHTHTSGLVTASAGSPELPRLLCRASTASGGRRRSGRS